MGIIQNFVEEIAIECKFFLGIFGHFKAREPNLYSIRFLDFLSVSIDFF